MSRTTQALNLRRPTHRCMPEARTQLPFCIAATTMWTGRGSDPHGRLPSALLATMPRPAFRPGQPMRYLLGGPGADALLPDELQLLRLILKYASKLLFELLHIVTRFHHGDHLLNLIVDLVSSELL